MFAAKASVPNAGWPLFRSRPMEDAANQLLTHFISPAGYLLTDSLAAALESRRDPLMWVRVGPEDRDPATLLLTLIHSARTIDRDIGASTLAQMKSQPGSIHGWRPLFKHLSEELAYGLPPSSALVLDQLQQFQPEQSVYALTVEHLLRQFPSKIARIIIDHRKSYTGTISKQERYFGLKDLVFDRRACLELSGAITSRLSQDELQRAARLVKGRPVALAGIVDACRRLGPGFIQQAIQNANDTDQFLVSMARGWLINASPTELRGLGLALTLGYFHPKIANSILGSGDIAEGPWLQPLVGGWKRVRALWQKPLLSTLRIAPPVRDEFLSRGAQALSKLGAVEIAVPIYLQLKDYESAIQAMATAVEDMINYGQWLTLKNWLGVIPENVIKDQPWLVYAQAEIQAASGQVGQARRNFASASRLFSDKQDANGACQSLLAESALAARQGDVQTAQINALHAHLLAHSVGLSWLRAWTGWQLGCLSVSASQVDRAVRYFSSAAQLADDPLAANLIRQSKSLAQEQQALIQRRNLHQEELQQAQSSLDENTERMERQLTTPSADLPAILETHGWLATPLMLKLSTDLSPLPEDVPSTHTTVIQTLSRLLGLERSRDKGDLPPSTNGLSPLDIPLNLPLSSQSALTHTQPIAQTNRPYQASDPLANILMPAKPAEERIAVYCLGTFRLFQNSRFIENWPSRKAQLVLKYLLLQHHKPISTDVLMDTFWPESDADSARRNLHQAIYVLRQTLRGEDFTSPHVQFENDGYRINPELDLWVDYEAFETSCRTAQQMVEQGLADQAEERFRVAELLYQDHLFAEDLYEDWIQPKRQYLWQLYLYIFDWLSKHYLERTDYQEAIALCQRVLARDGSLEAAHRILIQCFSLQGQRQLAIRQYQICVYALKEELGVKPSSETVQLYQSLL